MESHDGPTRATRRRVLGLAAAAAAGGIAGCSTTSDPGTDSPADTPGSTDTPEPTATDVPADQAASVPDDASCAVCNMKPAKFPDWNAQASHGNGDRAYFCSPGCLAAYVGAPGEFGQHQAVAHAWAHDVASGDLVDADAASWVLELDGSRNDAPMMKNPLPFAAESDALDYVGQYDDLTSHDVVPLSAFDLALAREYRGRLLPDSDEASVLDPVEPAEDETCGVCKMKPAAYPDWNGQVAFEDGERVHFCSPGCLGAYYADPGNFDDGRSQDGIVSAWAHDYPSKDLVDEATAWLVLETDGSRVDAPMMKNPVPFAERADAVGYVEEYDDLGEADVVPFTSFGVEQAKAYRGKFF